MAGNKTVPTQVGIDDYLASRASEAQCADCRTLMALLARMTEQSPQMWGPSIVGYGAYRYRYESGRTGTAPLVGFAIRGREIVLYLAPYQENAQALMERLGKHRWGKGCLYFKRLADLDLAALEQLVADSITELMRRHAP